MKNNYEKIYGLLSKMLDNYKVHNSRDSLVGTAYNTFTYVHDTNKTKQLTINMSSSYFCSDSSDRFFITISDREGFLKSTIVARLEIIFYNKGTTGMTINKNKIKKGYDLSKLINLAYNKLEETRVKETELITNFLLDLANVKNIK